MVRFTQAERPGSSNVWFRMWSVKTTAGRGVVKLAYQSAMDGVSMEVVASKDDSKEIEMQFSSCRDAVGVPTGLPFR